MLNIKSVYILQKIISFPNINEEKLLNIIRYNKALQNKLDINILNYRIMSRRYFIGDKKGKGKEYYCNETYYDVFGCYDYLIFEDEYKNGKRMEKEKNPANG